jgi:integrase
MRRTYYLHTRHNGIFYAELVDPRTGNKLAARSTGTRERDAALLVVAKWLEVGFPERNEAAAPRRLEDVFDLEGILRAIRKTELSVDDAMKIVKVLKERELVEIAVLPKDEGAVDFIEFLKAFWNYDSSDYVRERKSQGYHIGRTHCEYNLRNIKKYWEPFFKGKILNSITRKDLRKFSKYLSNQTIELRGKKRISGAAANYLSSKSISNIFLSGITALNRAFTEEMIPVNVGYRVVKVAVKTKKRGVLTPDEAGKIFSSEWESKESFAGNLLSCTTGMRRGEVAALRKSDIGDGFVNIRHSWNKKEGLKGTKTEEERKVPLLPEVKTELMKLLDKNPYEEAADPFVFYGSTSEKPLDADIFVHGLKAVCAKEGINTEERNIVFHSHRHYFAARMSDYMTAEQVRRMTGHKTLSVLKGYADHAIEENLQEASVISANIFGKILDFNSGEKEETTQTQSGGNKTNE